MPFTVSPAVLQFSANTSLQHNMSLKCADASQWSRKNKSVTSQQ